MWDEYIDQLTCLAVSYVGPDQNEIGHPMCTNYRGITVTPIIGKTFEYSMLRKLKLTNMTDWQFGFTEGLNPIMASLLISEVKCEKIKISKVKTPVLKEVGAFLISRILLKVFVRKEDINFLLFLRCSALIPYSSLL
jgi:hypothetical protein